MRIALLLFIAISSANAVDSRRWDRARWLASVESWFLPSQAAANGSVSVAEVPSVARPAQVAPHEPALVPAPSPALRSAPAVAPVMPETNISVTTLGNSTANQSIRDPRIYILFLATDKMSNLDVWNKWFEGVHPERYRAFIHCKDPSCISQVAGSFIVPVPTVGSWYCTDLVSPMIQLLSFAISQDLGPINPDDKFAFVSDSTLPAKPLQEIYDTLVNRKGSDFCVFPSNEWADKPMLSSSLEMVPKVFQWITLTRFHALKAVDAWNSNSHKDFMNSFGLNTKTWGNDNNYGDGRNWGCFDEFWFMAALMGPIEKVDADSMKFVRMDGFGQQGSSNLEVDSQAGWQGTCDTFVMWVKYAGVPGPFKSFLSTLDSESLPHPGNFMRPGWWDSISPTGIAAIRKSDFLFVRKFIDQPTLAGGGNFAETYAKLVYSTTPER